jgi:hypothetical protein
MPYEDKIHAPSGERIVKGSRVEIEWFDDEDGQRVEHHWLGTVDYITDSDGDADEEGRPYTICPRVFVQWDKDFADAGDLDDFSTTAHGGFEDDVWFECDELEVVK